MYGNYYNSIKNDSPVLFTEALERYVGGVVYWVYDGDDLRTIYIVDCSPCRVTENDTLELPVALTDLDQLEPSYDGPEVLGVILRGCKLQSPEAIIQIIKESKPVMFHITNVEYTFEHSWAFLEASEKVGMEFNDFTGLQLRDTIQKATDVTVMFDDVSSGVLKPENIEEFLKNRKIINDVWYVDLDLRTVWTDSVRTRRWFN